MVKIIKAVDLNTNLLYSENLIKFLKVFFDICILGVCSDKNIDILDNHENIILRKKYGALVGLNIQDSKNKNLFLTSSIFKGNIDENFHNVDILTISSLNNIKSLLKKYNGKNIGIEFLISDLKYYDNNELGKWFFNLKWIYELCKKYNFQFILSSGANMYSELISSKVFNTILRKMDIENIAYWIDLNIWLDDKKKGGIYYDTH
ncbi:MAG: hypothetical protein H0X03_01925 [Nitrosopumilus sp.]|nr:hypothetical protein [Nitrosopumilus sp.]